jgi:hypothetical protein
MIELSYIFLYWNIFWAQLLFYSVIITKILGVSDLVNLLYRDDWLIQKCIKCLYIYKISKKSVIFVNNLCFYSINEVFLAGIYPSNYWN